MSMAKTYVTVGGPLLPGNGKRGMALIEGESRGGERIMAFVAGKTAEECKSNFFERKHRSARVIAFDSKMEFRPNYLPIPDKVVDMAQLKAEGFNIVTYPSNSELFLIPDERPTPMIHDAVGHRIRSFVGYDLVSRYRSHVCTEDVAPQQLTPAMIKDVFGVLNLEITDNFAERLSLTQSAGGDHENMPPQAILEALVDMGKNAQFMCTNGRQFELFARREEFFPSSPSIDEAPRPDAPAMDAPDRPRVK